MNRKRLISLRAERLRSKHGGALTEGAFTEAASAKVYLEHHKYAAGIAIASLRETLRSSGISFRPGTARLLRHELLDLASWSRANKPENNAMLTHANMTAVKVSSILSDAGVPHANSVALAGPLVSVYIENAKMMGDEFRLLLAKQEALEATRLSASGPSDVARYEYLTNVYFNHALWLAIKMVGLREQAAQKIFSTASVYTKKASSLLAHGAHDGKNIPETWKVLEQMYAALQKSGLEESQATEFRAQFEKLLAEIQAHAAKGFEKPKQ